MPSRRLLTSVLVASTLAVAAHGAGAQERMPPLSTAELTEPQAQALAEFVAARGQPTGSWVALLRSPELMKRTRALDDYLNFESVLPGWLREFVILLTVREWGLEHEWKVRYPLAIDEGVSPQMAQAVAEGRRPEGMVDEEELLYELFMELQRNRGVSDLTYEKAVARFGEQGVVETVSLIGYYTTASMISSTTRCSADVCQTAGARAE